MIAYITELNSENYNEFVKNEYVLVDVWATWCGPCRQISPIVDQISSDFQGRLSVGKLDADANREIVAELGVRNIPTLIIFKNGEVLEKSSGMTTLEKLTELINSHLN
jgi:thioredoxin 1